MCLPLPIIENILESKNLQAGAFKKPLWCGVGEVPARWFPFPTLILFSLLFLSFTSLLPTFSLYWIKSTSIYWAYCRYSTNVFEWEFKGSTDFTFYFFSTFDHHLCIFPLSCFLSLASWILIFLLHCVPGLHLDLLFAAIHYYCFRFIF